jgi:energy-converting hydrogenase B subunit D
MTSLLVTVLIVVTLLTIAAVATAVVFTTEPFQQMMGMSAYGLVLTIFFFLLQAPDVALAQLGVGTVALPLVVLLALAKLKRRKKPDKRGQKQEAQA